MSEVQLEAVGPGKTLARQAPPVLRRDVDRTETLLRQPIARNVARLAATEASG